MVSDQWIFGTRSDRCVQNAAKRSLYNCIQGVLKEKKSQKASTIVSLRCSFSANENSASLSQARTSTSITIKRIPQPLSLLSPQVLQRCEPRGRLQLDSADLLLIPTKPNPEPSGGGRRPDRTPGPSPSQNTTAQCSVSLSLLAVCLIQPAMHHKATAGEPGQSLGCS